MENFMYTIPTKVHFGKGSIEYVPDCILEYGRRVLLVYGGGSIKKTGLYDTIMELLSKNNISYAELAGVEPNPRHTTVVKGIDICRREQVEVILAVGGGSTIDCAKGISAGVHYNGAFWDLVEDGGSETEFLPVIAVPTIAATGSEMDPYAVITNEELKKKTDMACSVFPKYAILDPEYTFSVPAYQTAAGTVDIMSHIFEVYFSKVADTYMQDRIMEALLKTCVKYGPLACKEPDNYDARANLMWASEWAINGFIACGKPGPWPAHSIEHQLSAQYDITHGHGLAIVIPRLMEYILNEQSVERFVSLGINVFEIEKTKEPMEIAKEMIKRLENLFQQMGLSTTLRDVGIHTKEKFDVMAEIAASEGLGSCLVPLHKQDIVKIYEACYK